jgi:hypothetical protein
MKKNNPFVTIKIIGGLGNQLFGYFFGLSISELLRSKLIIDGSLIKFGSNKDRVANVHNFVISTNDVFFAAIRKNVSNKIVSNRFVRKIYWKIISKFKVNISESKLDLKNFKFEKNKSYTGYFQNWFYVDYYLKNHPDFTFDINNKSSFFESTVKRMRDLDPICVHLRVGDYLNFPEIYKIIPVKYFSYCLDLLKREKPDSPVWVFIESREDLNLFYREIIPEFTEIFDKDTALTDSETFLLLCNAKNLIATNSTFSLWASWFVWKNGNKAFIPFQSNISGGSADLMDERWDRYDFENNKLYPGKFNEEKYAKMETEFLTKFM